MAELGLPDDAAYRTRLDADPVEWSVLDTDCWISVSRFCLDRGAFEDRGNRILPEFARAAITRDRRALRAWSVPARGRAGHGHRPPRRANCGPED
jgi:chemotaxis protein methyltransferase CheR